jgi:hypothetical protein
MAIEAQLFDGTIVEFPDDTDRSVIEKTVKRLTAERQPKEPEEKESALRKAADLPVNFTKGVVSGVRMLTDAFGADNVISKNLRGVEDYVGGLLSAQAKNDQQEIARIMKDAEDKGVLDQVQAGLKAFTVAPVDIMSQAFGTIIPTLAGGLAGAGLKIGARAAGIGTGAVMGAGTGKSAIYDAVTEELTKAGLPKEAIEQAATKAQEYGGQNLDLILANTLLGGAASATGIEKALIPGFTKNISQNLAKRGVFGRAAATGAPEFLTEGLQGGTEQLSQNVALQREGVDVPTFRGVAGAATMEGIAGGVLGGGVGAFSRPQAALIAPPRGPVQEPVQVPEQVAPAPAFEMPAIPQPRESTPMPLLSAEEARQQSYEQQVARQNAFQDNLDINQVIAPPIGQARAPVTEQDRLAMQLAAQQQMDADRFKQQTQPPVITPSQAIPRTPTQPLNAEQMRQRVDEQSALLGQMQNEPFEFDRRRLSTQADVAGGTGQVQGQPRAVIVDPNPMPPLQARQRLAVLKDELARAGQDPESLFIVPHPTMGGRFAIEQRSTAQPYVAPPIETPTVSPAAAQQRIEGAALAGSEAQRLNQDQPRQDMINRAMRNIEARGGVASPYEAQLLLEANMGRPYNRIDQGIPAESTLSTQSKREQELEQEYQAKLQAFRQGLSGPNIPAQRTVTPTVESPAAIEAERQARAVVENRQRAREEEAKERQRLNEQRRQMGLEQLAEDERESEIAARRQAEAEQRAAQKKQQEEYQQRQIELQSAFRNALPDQGELTDAFNTPAPLRTAEQLNILNNAKRLMSPDEFNAAQRKGEENQRSRDEDYRVLQIAEKAPATLTAADRVRLNAIKKGQKYSLSNNPTPEAKASADEMRKKLLPILKRFGLGDVGLRLVDSIENGTADGMYAKQVITLALDSDNPLGVMRHEAIHALKELGAFTPAEWKVLTKAAKDAWINQFFDRAMQDRYQAVYLEQNGNLDGFQEYLQEEAIAQAFRFFTDTKPPSGMIANLMRRLNAFFNALTNFLTGQGFTDVDQMFLPNRIFADIERGAITPGRAGNRVEMTPREWQAKPADVEQAIAYDAENGIAPYLSEGQLELAVPQARYSIKPSYTPKQLAKGDVNNHPIFGLPLNKNGTITLYLPTNNAEARRVVKEKKLQGNTPDSNRIYLTNESNGAKVMQNPGNIDHTMDGANVMIQVDPAYLQLDQEYADGRKDFFIQIAEGEAFAKKMAQTKLFTLDAPRDRAISKETTLAEIEAKIEAGINAFKDLPAKEKKQKLKEARNVLKQQHNVGTLLSENGKLQKTRVGDYGIKFEGNSVASMGLGLASAQKITEKLSTCPRSARCEGLCLGETSGQNLLYGGEGQFKSGPRLSQYLKTEAMVIHPEEFAIVLYDEINRFKNWSEKSTGTETVTDEAGNKVKVEKQVYQPAIRLNVTSDFAPKVFESVINAFPSVEFYDYTKLNTKSIAPNHHLTYSSDGVAQVVNGKTVGVGSNWKEMTKKLDNGFNVAMAFTSRKAMPEFLLDEATGKKYQVWNGDNYDARFLDPKPGEKGNKLNQGMIVGLTNKDRTGKPEDAAIKNDGFFVDYDPARDGKTLVIKDQQKISGEKKIIPIGVKFSLREPKAPEFKRWFKDSKVVDENGKPLVMYHATTSDFSKFDTERKSLMGAGSWFSREPSQQFAEGEGGNIMPVYLSLQNPMRMQAPINYFDKNKLMEQGYDGVLITSPIDGRTTAAVAFQPTQIKSSTGNVGTFDVTNPDVRYSLRAPKTPEFKRFFGNSKVVKPDGTPRVMYHGTARVIDEFIPKQAGAIFVTENPAFAEKFSEDSVQYMVMEQIDKIEAAYADMSPEDKVKLLKKAYRLGIKQKDISKKEGDARIREIEYSLVDGSFPNMQQSYFNTASEFLRPSIRKELTSGENIMPLYVRAENPFDFENPAHVNQVYARLANILSEQYAIPKERLATGDWPAIEDETVQQIIKDLGHDGFYVKEGGEKNLAVYNPNQIKSAIGNRGTYDETGRILYSLKNAPPNQYTKLADDDPSTGEAMIDAATSAFNAVRNDGTRTSGRIALVDKYAGMSKTLQSLPLFNDGVLRADMLHHAKAQGINLIKGGLVTGTPILNDDGTIGIEASENNLARAAYLADDLNANKNVVESGLSGRGYVATIARALRGLDILEEDKATRALGDRQIREAKRLSDELKQDVRAGALTPRQIAQAQNAINQLRKLGSENRKVNRELQVKPEDIAWAKKQLDMTPEVQEILDIWKTVNTSLVNLWEDVGLIDKETADKYRAQKNYVPLFKSREDLNEEGFFRTGTGAKTTAKVKELKGADITRNIWENIDKQFATMIAAAYENQTRRVSVEQMRSISPELAEITNASDKRVNLRYRDGGKDVHVIIENPNDLAAFQSMTYQMGPIMQIFGGFTKVLRAGALLNPMFWLRQLIRDPISATLTGQAGVVTPFHSAKEFLTIITRNSEEARILASRGVIGQFDSTVSLQEFLGDVGKEKQKSPGVIQRGLHKLLEIHEASDAATRVAIFKQAKAKALKDGMSEKQAVDYAVFKARESINFAITGNSQFLAAARNMIPFLNATIVGLDTLYRAATGYGLNPEEKAKAQRMFAARASMLVAMSFAYAAMMQDDDDYKKLPDYMKDGNWLFPTSDKDGKTFVRLPVPYEVGYLFKTIPEVLVRYMSGTSTGKEALASLKAGFIQNMPTGGVPIPQFAKPTLEVITNHSFHTGRNIEGVGDSLLPVSDRGRKASEFAKMMSKAGLDNIGMSPAKIDVFLKGTFAEMGTFGLELADSLILAASGKEKTPKNFENMPFMRSFLTDPQVNKAISDFYELEKSATQVANLFTQYKNEGRGEELQALVSNKEKLAQVQAAPVLRKLAQEMTKINKAINTIDNSKDIPPQERRDRINELQRVLATVAQQGYQVAGIAGLPR